MAEVTDLHVLFKKVDDLKLQLDIPLKENNRDTIRDLYKKWLLEVHPDKAGDKNSQTQEVSCPWG
jgi:hypothetical protein